jgi:NADH:ubiquinone oxidoreductase subunit 5 (subunit L)/multisubunit Na+/H+ antiporter MnhA subunit
MGGLAKRMPVLSVSLCVLILAAAALPPFGPFFAEWVFLQSLVIGMTLAAPFVKGILIATLVITALVGGLAIFAMVKLFAISMLGEPRTPQADSAHDPSGLILFPVVLLSVLVVIMGLLAPRFLSFIQLRSSVSLFTSMTDLSAGLGSIKPLLIGFLLSLCILAVWLFRRVFTDVKNERFFHSWDCGQPIDASMEYTATAFSAPIRFFFRSLLGIRKSVEVQPLCEGNPWITKQTMIVHLRSIWMDFGYTPVGKTLLGINEWVKKIQNGNIRFYLFLLLMTLLLTIWIAL